MKRTIKQIDGTIVAESDTGTFAELAVASKSNLSGAYLRGAHLRGADLTGANLPHGVSIVQVSGIGSSRRMTTYRIDTDEVWCECFKGTLAEFGARVREQYPNGKFRAEYDAAIRFFGACRAATKGGEGGR